jgi:hypothetical protein
MSSAGAPRVRLGEITRACHGVTHIVTSQRHRDVDTEPGRPFGRPVANRPNLRDRANDPELSTAGR